MYYIPMASPLLGLKFYTRFHDGKQEDFLPIFEHLIKGMRDSQTTPICVLRSDGIKKISMTLTMTVGVKHSYPQLRASRKKLSPSNPQTNNEQYHFTSARTPSIAYLAFPISTVPL